MASIKGAVIGIRGIGKWHAGMMRDTGNIDVVALCDVDEAHKKFRDDEFPDAKFYSSHKEMLNNEQLDLVAVVTPHDLHAPLAIDALNAGANVVTEKPMATTYADCRAMIAAAEENGKFVTVFHNRRMDPWFLAAQDAIHDGLLGSVFEMNIGIAYGPSTATWRGFKKASGGLMFDWGAHLVDYALHFDPSAVTQVSGFLFRATETNADENETHGTLRIYFESGAVANVTVSGADRHCPERYKFVGTQGTLIDTWDHSADGQLKVYGRLSGGETTDMTIAYRKSRIQDFYDNIAAHMQDDIPLMVSGESAAKVINVLQTAERSSAEGGKPLPLA